MWTRLPKDILRYIFGFFDRHDVIMYRLVCKSWYSAIDKERIKRRSKNCDTLTDYLHKTIEDNHMNVFYYYTLNLMVPYYFKSALRMMEHLIDTNEDWIVTKEILLELKMKYQIVFTPGFCGMYFPQLLHLGFLPDIKPIIEQNRTEAFAGIMYANEEKDNEKTLFFETFGIDQAFVEKLNYDEFLGPYDEDNDVDGVWTSFKISELGTRFKITSRMNVEIEEALLERYSYDSIIAMFEDELEGVITMSSDFCESLLDSSLAEYHTEFIANGWCDCDDEDEAECYY